MKRNKTIKLFILLIALVLTSSSCQRKKADDDNSLYYFDSTNGVIYKTNLNTGVVTPLCDDPVCKHDTFDCKFSNAHSPTLIGTTVYFYRESGIVMINNRLHQVTHICSYDYETRDYKVYRESTHNNVENVCGRFDVHMGYIYFYQQAGEDYKFALKRINIETSKTEEFDWISDRWHFAIYNERLYFSDDTDGIYSTDINLQDKQYHVKPEENTLIYARRIDGEGNIFFTLSEKKDTETKTETLKKYDSRTGEKHTIDSAYEITHVHIIDGKVYYLKGYISGGIILKEKIIYKWNGDKPVEYRISDKDFYSLTSCGNYLVANTAGAYTVNGAGYYGKQGGERITINTVTD